MRNLCAAVVAVIALSCAALLPTPSRAQTPISVTSEEAVNEFPRGVTFTLEFTAPEAAKEVRLQYELTPDGTGASAVVECNGARTITCEHTLISGAGIFVIPGANITYHWDIEDEAGNKLSTEDKLYVHEDTRFTFETVVGENVTVYYHSGRVSQAEAVLDAALETLDRVGELQQTDVPFPVKIILYATAEEMEPAIVGGGSGGSILGEVVYSDTAMVSADVQTLDITRHEVTHIITREATKGPFGIPDWMNEGTSVFAQNDGLSGHDAALGAAIRSDNVLSMKELNSPSAGDSGSSVGLYYGQAGSMIAYLVDTYGEDKFAEILRVFKEGATPDNAFNEVYGFDELGLENEWRASVGLDPVQESASPTPRPIEATRGAATPAGGDDDPNPASSSDDDGASVITIAIIVALAAIALAALGALALLIMSRGKTEKDAI